MNQTAISVAFDFETTISRAVASVLNVNGFKAQAMCDQHDFKSPRPRVDVLYRHGGVRLAQRAVMPDGSLRYSAFHGSLELHTVTDPDAPGKAIHGAYRASVRWFANQLPALLNGSALLSHKVQDMVEGATNVGFHPELAFEISTISFDVQLSMQANVWPVIYSTGTS